MPWKHHWIFMDTGFFLSGFIMFHPPFWWLHRLHRLHPHISPSGHWAMVTHEMVGGQPWCRAGPQQRRSTLALRMAATQQLRCWLMIWGDTMIYIYFDIGILKDFIPKLAILQHFTQENGGSNNRHGGCNITHTNLTNINRDFIKQEVYRLDCFSP